MLKATRLALVGILIAGMSQTLTGQDHQTSRQRPSKPDASFPEPFSEISGLRELSDGRLLISDRLEQQIRLVDLSAGTYERVGQVGAGPGEYRMPGELLPLPADSSLLTDFGNMRATAVTPAGGLGESMPLLRDEGLFINPQATDARGRLYFEMVDLGGHGAGTERSARDSVAIVRWERGNDVVDTLAMLPSGLALQVRTAGGGLWRGAGIVPFTGRDAWGVAPDGRVAVARAEDYHIEWVGGSQRIVGSRVDYQPVKITKADREAWADRLASRAVVMAVGEGGAMRGGRTMSAPRPDPDELEWPEVKSPFPRGAVSVSPEGEVWVQRHVAFGEPPTFDVFDSSARRIKQVVLPEGREFVGFGKGTLFAVRVDDDGLQWLERYRR